MLIRSQDRKSLVDINGMTIKIRQNWDEKFWNVIAYGNNNPDDTMVEYLGSYPTEERAIRMLDEISSWYRSYSQRYKFTCTEYAIFNMPTE